MKITTSYTATDALQARLAARLVAGLGEQAAALPHDISERLRVAREQAVSRARELRSAAPAAAATPVVVAGQRGSAALLGGGSPPWWQRMASVMPLLVLLVGLVLISNWSAREQLLAAADIDSSLLADDLPPAAYTDPGFAEFLKLPAP
jgi:hypothetical protein